MDWTGPASPGTYPVRHQPPPRVASVPAVSARPGHSPVPTLSFQDAPPPAYSPLLPPTHRASTSSAFLQHHSGPQPGQLFTPRPVTISEASTSHQQLPPIRTATAPPPRARPAASYSASLPVHFVAPMPVPFASSPIDTMEPGLSGTGSDPRAAQPPDTYPLPAVHELHSTLPGLDGMADSVKLFFAQDALRLLERHMRPASQTTSVSTSISPQPVPRKLMELVDVVIPIIISFTTHSDNAIRALALYLRGHLQAEGDCPEYLPKDPRQAFSDFEAAARTGDPKGWYRLGRDYETVGDITRARDCFERGRAKGNCESNYRLGMAHLLGQLNLQVDPAAALPLLASASKTASIDFPLPAYIYGILLCGELQTPHPVPAHLVHPASAPPELLLPQQQKAFKALSYAAYLHHPPAQYKMGFLYEHAALGCPYDPLMSVQWYSLGSQGGDMEADMGLSKWFLCGAEGCFPKNEDLARTFAEKAARKGHANGCFAMGYYFEVGIGGRQDMEQARKWYNRAARLDNPDAVNRLRDLDGPAPHALSSAEHQTRLNDTLVRRRTTAKNRSDRMMASRPAAKSVFAVTPTGPGPTRQGGHTTEAERRSAGTDRTTYLPGVVIPAGDPHISPRPDAVRSPRPADQAPQPGDTMSPRPDGSRAASPRSGGVRRATLSPMPMPNVQSPALPHPAPWGATSRLPRPRRATLHPDDVGDGYSARPPPLPGSPMPDQLANGLRRVSLTDSPVPARPPKTEEELEAEREAKRERERQAGPQTFAEMGLVSKPVEEEGCRVM